MALAEEGGEKTLWYLRDGCCFNETPLFAINGGMDMRIMGDARFYHECVEDSYLCAFSVEDVLRLGARQPELLLNLCHSFSFKVTLLSQQVVSLSLESQMTRVCKFLASRIVPGSQPLRARRDTLTARVEQLQKQISACDARLEQNRTARAAIDTQRQQHAAVRARWQWVHALAATANGAVPGKEKIMLETYIQTAYFDRILGRANTRLLIMSGGQYELRRCARAGDNRSQTGLELEVIDHYNGTARSVKTLSGGETFAASLSLALGLSDEVQATAGGVQLEAMFVDEGFGSLDSEALQQALAALVGVSGGSRIVGIISHVAELKDRIDRQIIVTKDRSGGSRVQVQA